MDVMMRAIARARSRAGGTAATRRARARIVAAAIASRACFFI